MNPGLSANPQPTHPRLIDLSLSSSSQAAVIARPPKRRATLNRTTSTEEIRTQPKTGFFSLPFELRWQIYELLIPISDCIYSCNNPGRRAKPCETRRMTQLQALLLVCRRMNQVEPIKEIFYRHHTFVVDHFSHSLPAPSRTRSNQATLNPKHYFLGKFSWMHSMPMMRKMLFRLAPPNTIETPPRGSLWDVGCRPRLPNPRVDFEHHDGWKRTLGNLSVLGLHIYNPVNGDRDWFPEWLFHTLWSLVGALPRAEACPTPRSGEKYSGIAGERDGGIGGVKIPPGPMIVVYIHRMVHHGSESRVQEAKDIVESVIPRDRFRYVENPVAMHTPFLDRKRIMPAWELEDPQDSACEVLQDALDSYLRELVVLNRKRMGARFSEGHVHDRHHELAEAEAASE